MKAYEVTATRQSDGNEITRRIHAKDEKTARDLLEKLVNPEPGEAPPVPEVPLHGDGTTPVLPAGEGVEDNQHPENQGKDMNGDKSKTGDHEINKNDGEAAENLIDGGKDFDSSVHDNKGYPGARKKEPGLLPSEQPSGDELGRDADGDTSQGEGADQTLDDENGDENGDEDENGGTGFDDDDPNDANKDDEDEDSGRKYGKPREGLSRRNSDEVKQDEEIDRLAKDAEMNPKESDLSAKELLEKLQADADK